jgi:protease-4
MNLPLPPQEGLTSADDKSSEHTQAQSKDTGKTWERQTLEFLVAEQIKEKRADRRTKIAFRIIYIALFIGFWLALLGLFEENDISETKTHTALIRITGVIDSEGDASAENIVGSLEEAFSDKNTKGIILAINSPGGSPVQSGIIYDEIMRLKKLHPNKPVYAVTEDVCASGAYYIAAAADKIFVDKASIVGSIGVVMDGFGFVEGMKKLGIERRVLTSGENKSVLDPFSPVRPQDEEHMRVLLSEVHQQFIDAVKEGRGGKLSSDPTLFTGLFWTGAKAINLGLADDFGNINQVARDIIKESHIVEYKQSKDFVNLLGKNFGIEMGKGVLQQLTPPAKLR